MTSKKVVENDLLFHPAHGLCRVDKVIEQSRSGKKLLSYSLVPKTMNKMKVRFVVTAKDAESSGFHRVISAGEAGRLLDYLKAGDDSVIQTGPAWVLARNILSFAADNKLKARDQRKRQLLERSIKGLVGELACALKISLKETASCIEKSLTKMSKIDSLVLAALGRAAEG
jgi:RNA polymerase-interacting CarD/CdnL/TRCF family regulator